MAYTLAQEMKTLIQLLLVISATLTLVSAEDAMLPPEDQRAEWTELQEQQFSEWTIKSFLGWDVPFDGGSKVFFFESDRGTRFDLVVAHTNYWTVDDKKLRRQVFLIRHKNRFYRIDPKSDEEKNIIKKLTEAASQLSGERKKDPKLLTILAERLKSREPIFKTEG